MSYGIAVKVDGLGYLEKSWATKSRHDVKSLAGRAFHKSAVTSVCVYNDEGQVELYLKKTPNGVRREVR